LNLTGVNVLYPGAVQSDAPPQFSFGGGRIANSPNIGSNNSPFYSYVNMRDFSVSLSKILGSHNVKTGLFWQNSFKPQSSFANNNGVYNFNNEPNNPFDTGFGFSNAATGVYNTFNQASGYYIGKYRYNNVETYIQDTWKVTSRLTLDYGLRLYWMQPQYDEDLQTANFLPERYNRADAPLLYRPICLNNLATCGGTADRRAVDPRLLTPGFVPTESNTVAVSLIGRIVPNTGKLTNGIVQAGAGIERGLYKNRGVNFAPRFGFAYDVRGDQTLVVRGGGGMFYDRPQGNVVFDLVQNPPVTIQPNISFGRMQDVGSGQLVIGPPSLVAIDRSGKVPTTYAYNLGVQYKLPSESVLDVSYVGTLGVHLLQRRSLNAPAYGAAYLPENQDPTLAPGSTPGASALPIELLRPYPGFGQIQYIEPASSSNYHSLQMSINRRFTKGLLLGANYTWSKALGTQTGDLSGITSFGAPNILDNRRANYGPLDFDRRHNFNLNWVYQFQNLTERKALGYALNNWQLSGIFRYVTGSPYNLGFNIPSLPAYTLTGTQNTEGARIVLLKNPGSGNSSNPYRQFDVTAVTTPKPGSTGIESGRNFLYRAPINSWDLSLSKRFRIKEKVGLEFRLDAFNALNHTQFDGINTTLNVSSLNNPTPTNLGSESARNLWTGFGAVTSVRPPRNLQLTGRIEF
jgi:hypothetical protein